MSRKSTAQDVADLAGVSRSAVSLVLNGRASGAISAAKQKAVLDAARRLEYSPNMVAKSLRTSRTHILGVLTWRGLAGLPLPLLASTLETSLHAGYQLLKMYAEPTELDQRRALGTLTSRLVDGILVISPELCEYHAVEALSAVPVVLLNCVDPSRLLSSVAPDEEAAGARAGELLIERGHRSVGLLRGSLSHHQTGQRAYGLQRVLLAAGLPPAVPQVSEVRIDAGIAAATALLTAADPPTALVCTNERLAVGAFFAAAALGLRVPEDLSVVSLDDREQLAGQLSPAVTLVSRPDDQMAAQAAELLIERLESGTDPATQHYSFVCPVVEGGSVAAPAVVR
ncbi:LacI family DNA-binding transcriptional regulator [uncultured Friedmanniella sp.]|uniref:LacI family DNA-binding transcriptional regulator n=1 Tax=uncultured Friedmanniella sp. TaxID=335381 RepID=UPI0035CBECE7